MSARGALLVVGLCAWLRPSASRKFNPPKQWTMVQGPVSISSSTSVRRRLDDDGGSDGVAEAVTITFTVMDTYFAFDMELVDVFTPNATYVVNEGSRSRPRGAPPVLPVYHGATADAWAQVGFQDGLMHAMVQDAHLGTFLVEPVDTFNWESDGGAESRALDAPLSSGEFIAYRVADLPLEDDAVEEHEDEVMDITDDIRAELNASALSGHGRRLRVLNELPEGPPYGRMVGCWRKPELRTMELGLVVDISFVEAVGGTEKEATEFIAHHVGLASAIYADQIGLEIRVKHLILNLEQGGEYAETGPNMWNQGQSGRNKCWPAKDNRAMPRGAPWTFPG